jgi:protein-S-isoprenylcysteine O-methyltransferase Ste14
MAKNWPALMIGIIISIYWLRVMIMVRQSPKKTGHGANLVPPERLGRVLRLVWVPVIVLWILLPFVAFIVRRPQRFPRILRPLLEVRAFPPALGWVAAAGAALCLLATFVCWRRMGTSWRMGIDPNDRTQLVCSGPYAFVRHPIYGLSSLMMLATIMAAPNPLMIGAGVVHLLLLQWEARREERHLIRLHGDEYAQYARRTGRFFPRSFHGYPGSVETTKI